MKTHHIVSVVLAVLAIVGLITFMFTKPSVPKALAPSDLPATTTPATSDDIVPISKSFSEKPPATIAVGEPHMITVRGTQTCLEFRDQTGPHIMSCAIGLKTTEGKYYALSDTSSDYQNIQKFSGEGTFEVRGLFTPIPDTTYITEGTIAIESVREL